MTEVVGFFIADHSGQNRIFEGKVARRLWMNPSINLTALLPF